MGAAALATCLSLASPRAGRAETTPDSPAWYGWQTVSLDVGAGVLVAIGVGESSVPTVGLGAAVFFLGGPLVHVGHGDGRWWKSLAWRVGLPLAGAGLGALVVYLSAECNPNDSFCPDLVTLGGAVVGAGAGAVAASVVDAATLGREATPAITPLPGGGVLLGLSAAW